MANKIIQIGKQTTNLLSNDNLIIYSDISMKSDFNVKSITYGTGPISSDYIVNLITEKDTPYDKGNKKLKVNDSDDELVLFTSSRYIDDLRKHYDRLNTSKFKVSKNINVRAIQQSIHNIFSWIPGERILNPEFGNTLHKLLYNGITSYNQEQIIAEIKRCLSEYEPRVKLEYIKNVSSIDDTENNTIRLEIVYSIPSLNTDQYAYTYIYHEDEF